MKHGLVITLVALVIALITVVCGGVAGDGFRDWGVGGKVAQVCGVVAAQTPDPRCLVIANALGGGPCGCLLVTDVGSGLTTQVHCPEDVPRSAAYGSILASNGHFHTARGVVLLEFDPSTARGPGTTGPLAQAATSAPPRAAMAPSGPVAGWASTTWRPATASC